MIAKRYKQYMGNPVGGKAAYNEGQRIAEKSLEVVKIKEGVSKTGKAWTIASFKLQDGSDAAAFVNGAKVGQIYEGHFIVKDMKFFRYNLGGKFILKEGKK